LGKAPDEKLKLNLVEPNLRETEPASSQSGRHVTRLDCKSFAHSSPVRYQSFIAAIESGQRRIDVIEFLALAEAIGFGASRGIREVAAKNV